MSKNYSNKKLVEVLWTDAQRSSGWVSETEIVESGLNDFHSVGILVRETSEALYLTIGMCHQYCPDNPDCLGIHMIPIGMVKSVRPLGFVRVEVA